MDCLALRRPEVDAQRHRAYVREALPASEARLDRWVPTCDGSYMPNQHKHPQVKLRGIPQEEIDAFDAAAAAMGSNRSAKCRELMAWFAMQPGAIIPLRPHHMNDSEDE